MINTKSVLAIITARAGSKGLPGKNSLELNGKPLIQYSIEAGLKSKYVDKIILTTDCMNCIDIAKKLGIETPFIRPSNLAGDKVPSFDVIEHTLNFLKENGKNYDILVLLEPTSPLRDHVDLDKALEEMTNENRHSLVSVAKSEDQHPDFTFTISNDNSLVPWKNESFSPSRRQDISLAYFLDGSIYIAFIDIYLKKKTFCFEGTMPFIMPKFKSFEIDDIVDFICVEAIMKNLDEILSN